ncbi:MAG: D-alanyl-D-alanine carboxypeptidase family protein [Campylobacterales bacterium]|nr:D-alanyl-D-alanine carboxypeptidase family protein [Campylobacterales bacterium]
MKRRAFLKIAAATPLCVDALSLEPRLDAHSAVREAIYLDAQKSVVAKGLLERLMRVQRMVGFGNFNLISFDVARKVAKSYGSIGAFSPLESALFEELFAFDARSYGFFGAKVIERMNTVLRADEMVKVPSTGHYLYKGEALRHYEEIRGKIGEAIVLTSGVRGVVKQMALFLSKALSLEGNLSQASRSLAPAGYSYHGIGDFDVGKVGFGVRNFTQEFESTDEFKRLMDLGFVSIRYPEANPFGVQYEPWHIKVV